LHRINHHIKAETLRVTSDEGGVLGVMKTSEALALAKEKGLDLVEISSKTDPPIAKIVEYGKMLYILKKKEQKQKKAGKAKEQKGVRLTFRMGVGDMERQANQAKKFLLKGYPLKIQMVMKGRERAHSDLAVEKTKKFIASLKNIASIDQHPKQGGFQIIATLKPSNKNIAENTK